MYCNSMVHRPLRTRNRLRALAYWIHDYLPYSELQFFPAICAFNISWHEKPKKSIYSFIEPKGHLLREQPSPSGQSALYTDFPALRHV